MSDIQDTCYMYVKGDFVKNTKASISPYERGFKFGDGVFETIRLANGCFYQWDLHIKRLKGSLKLLKIDAYLDGLDDICKKLINKNKLSDGLLRISISRGVGSKGYMPDIDGGATIVIETINQYPKVNSPVNLWVSSYKKIPSCCLPPNAKTMQGVNSTLARMEAKENKCFEALLLSVDGHICEASSSNIFWVKDNQLFTPAPESGILCGTIRDLVIRLSPYKVKEGIFNLDQLENADEIFLTNVAWLVAQVKQLQPKNLSFNKFSYSSKIKELILEDINAACKSNQQLITNN